MTYHAIGQLNLSMGPAHMATTTLRRPSSLVVTPTKKQALTYLRPDAPPPASPPPPPPEAPPIEPLAPDVQQPHDATAPSDQPVDEYYVDPYAQPQEAAQEPSATEALLPEQPKRSIPWKWIGIGIAVVAGGAFLITRD